MGSLSVYLSDVAEAEGNILSDLVFDRLVSLSVAEGTKCLFGKCRMILRFSLPISRKLLLRNLAVTKKNESETAVRNIIQQFQKTIQQQS